MSTSVTIEDLGGTIQARVHLWSVTGIAWDSSGLQIITGGALLSLSGLTLSTADLTALLVSWAAEYASEVDPNATLTSIGSTSAEGAVVVLQDVTAMAWSSTELVIGMAGETMIVAVALSSTDRDTLFDAWEAAKIARDGLSDADQATYTGTT